MAKEQQKIIIIAGDSYQPEELLVDVGTEVVWQNDDEEPHTVHDDEDRFASGPIKSGATWSRVFSERGTFPYHCDYHPFMTGSVVVE